MKFLIQKETHHTYLFLYLFCFILKKNIYHFPIHVILIDKNSSKRFHLIDSINDFLKQSQYMAS